MGSITFSVKAMVTKNLLTDKKMDDFFMFYFSANVVFWRFTGGRDHLDSQIPVLLQH